MSSEILVVEDDEVLNQLLVKQLADMGHAPKGVANWCAAREYLTQHEPDLLMTDVRLPDADGLELLPQLAAEQPVIVLTAYGSVRDAVKAMKAGATEYLIKPVNLDELELVVGRALENAALREEHQFYKRRMQTKGKTRMIGRSTALARVSNLIYAVASSDSNVTVLIQGESGVGKELVAKAIHERSLRAERNFVTVDCCALQEKLFESELFGHERGAFTGADRQKKGLIECADGGTVFLDEIGEIEPVIQAKLLRVLETGQFRRLGGTKDLHADVRVVAATNRNLEVLSREGRFRSDLFYRLSAFMIPVPPLRERRGDIPELVQHFISNHDFSQRISKSVSSTAMKRLVSYDWPGNVRELKNVIERAIILSREVHKIRQKHLAFGHSETEAQLGLTLEFNHDPTLDEIEHRYLGMLLSKYSGHRSKVASALGISERSVYRLIDKHGLSKDEATSIDADPKAMSG